jgi:hypothetical protein
LTEPLPKGAGEGIWCVVTGIHRYVRDALRVRMRQPVRSTLHTGKLDIAMHGQFEDRCKLPVEVKFGDSRNAAHRFQVQITVRMLVYVVQHPLHPGMVVSKRRLHHPFLRGGQLVAHGHNVLDRSCGFGWINPETSHDCSQASIGIRGTAATVKGIGRRPGPAEREEVGRRPIAAKARIRGQQAPTYGVLGDPVQAQKPDDVGDLTLKRGNDAHGPASNQGVARRRADRW